MPLPVEVQTLPLFVLEKATSVNPRNDMLGYLPVCRAMTLIFWWLLLGSTFLASRRFGNSGAALVAVALVASQPVLLGHASLATTDLPLTASIVTLVIAYRIVLDRCPETRIRRRWAAVFVAFAMLCKASSMVFAPVCLIAVDLHQRWLDGWRPHRGLVNWWPVVESIREVLTIHLMGNVLTLLVCPRMLKALIFQFGHNLDGHYLVYLLGKTDTFGFWYYFPLALACKVSLTSLALIGLAVLTRVKRLGNPLFLAALGLLVLSPIYRVQIGVRFVLPIIVLAIAGASVALFGDLDWSAATRWRRWAAMTVASVLIALSSFEAGQVWPHGLCFTNQLFGGTDQGYLALCESNYDWGQGLDDLLAWHKAQQEPPTSLWYFGTDPRVGTSLPLSLVDGNLSTAEEFRQLNRGKFVAVGLTNLYGYSYHSSVSRMLRGLAPCARTQTFLIYDFRESGLVAQADASSSLPVIFRR